MQTAPYGGAPRHLSLWLTSLQRSSHNPLGQPRADFAPNLRHLKIGNGINEVLLSRAWTILPFRGLETLAILRAREVNPGYLFASLKASPGLRKLRLDDCSYGPLGETNGYITSPITLPKLESLKMTKIGFENWPVTQFIIDRLDVHELDVLELSASTHNPSSIYITRLPHFMVGSILAIASRSLELNIDIQNHIFRIRASELWLEGRAEFRGEFTSLVERFNSSSSKFSVRITIEESSLEPEDPPSEPLAWDEILLATVALKGVTYLSLRRILRPHLHFVLDALSFPDAQSGWALPNLVELALEPVVLEVDFLDVLLTLTLFECEPANNFESLYGIHQGETSLSGLLEKC